MKHAEICPVCKGTGKYKRKKCHGCNGKGWVEIGTDPIVIPPIKPTRPMPTIPPIIPPAEPFPGPCVPNPYVPKWPPPKKFWLECSVVDTQPQT
jgi:hypothetical protein